MNARSESVTRDHQDLGSSVCNIGGIGAAHYFHSRNPDPDGSRHARDDRQATDVDWPELSLRAEREYHRVAVQGEVHPLLQRADGTTIEWLPAPR